MTARELEHCRQFEQYQDKELSVDGRTLKTYSVYDGSKKIDSGLLRDEADVLKSEYDYECERDTEIIEEAA